MGLPSNEQYIRGMALESAVRFASGPAGLKKRGVVAESMDVDDVLELADKFADYIQFGSQGE